MSAETKPDHYPQMPSWVADVLGVSRLEEGMEFTLDGQAFVVRNGLPRSKKLISDAQKQTSETFNFKWRKVDSYDSEAYRAALREWLINRYGDLSAASWLPEHGELPMLIDAGCGAGLSSLELLGPLLSRIRYLGVDVSEAVDVACQRFAQRGYRCGFMQADITNMPLPPESVDLIFSEGVLHHTDSTERALKSLARLLKPGGRFLFYVYKKKGPIREFTDDYIRAKLQAMSPAEAWKAMEPLTRLGISLGKLNAEIDIPQPIDLLGIPAGRINVQRLFYWHVAKMFYRPDFSLEEMNHINFDWYAPANAHRQTPEEVRRWCAEANLTVEREVVEDAGITIIARKNPTCAA